MKAIAFNFMSSSDDNGPFKLFSDDFSPHNVLVDESTLQVTAAIDWEFCYAAPAQFASSIPWWLLLQKPDDIINESDGTTFLLDIFPQQIYSLEYWNRRKKQNQ